MCCNQCNSCRGGNCWNRIFGGWFNNSNCCNGNYGCNTCCDNYNCGGGCNQSVIYVTPVMRPVTPTAPQTPATTTPTTTTPTTTTTTTE